MKVKDLAITMTAGQLRLSETQVRNVVDEYEKNRSAANRSTKKRAAAAAPKKLGGGWYEMPDGSKVQGAAAAGLE